MTLQMYLLDWDASLIHNIKIKPNVQPVVHPPRRLLITVRPKVKAELQRMEKLDVIEKLHEPTEWVNSMAVVTKPNGKLRICIDPRDLNQAIRREYYLMRTQHAYLMPKYFQS